MQSTDQRKKNAKELLQQMVYSKLPELATIAFQSMYDQVHFYFFKF